MVDIRKLDTSIQKLNDAKKLTNTKKLVHTKKLTNTKKLAIIKKLIYAKILAEAKILANARRFFYFKILLIFFGSGIKEKNYFIRLNRV